MKKLLTAIATTAAVALAGTFAAPAARALPTVGDILGDGNGTYQTDLAQIYNNYAGYDESVIAFSDAEKTALDLTISALENTTGQDIADYGDKYMYMALLSDPSQLDSLYSGSDPASDVNTSGFGVFTVQGCSVNADCALKAIGLSLSIQCAGQVGVGNLYNPEAWAECVEEKDLDAYRAAVGCIWGDCPFTAAPGQKVYACNNSPNAVVAGKVLLNLPPSLSQGKNDFMEIGLLSQG